MRWQMSNHHDPRGCALADRHYSRQTIGSNQFMPSGRSLVLITSGGDALWGTSWQVGGDGTAYAVHAWPEAWNCCIFRNESSALSSDLIVEAVAATRAMWGDPPRQGFVTFVDADKVRHKRDPGRCYRRAGWDEVGRTASGKVALVLPPGGFPDPDPPIGGALSLLVPERLTITRQRLSIGGAFAEVRS